jgi:hypothetical protein
MSLCPSLLRTARLPLSRLLVLLALATPALAQHTAQQRDEDIRRHRAMAAAHEAAAQCLAATPRQTEQACQEALQKACKGLALGKYCGMRHAH